MCLFYPYASQNGLNPRELWNDACLIDYADVGYIFDPHKARSQTGYVLPLRIRRYLIGQRNRH